MKIHIVNKDEESIEGYSKVEVENGSLDLTNYSNNECTFILASDLADMFRYEELPNNLSQIRAKMRLGSTLVVGGTDARLLCRAVKDWSIDFPTMNNVIYSKSSCSSLNTLEDIVSSLGLQVITTKISGVHYEIECQRK